LYHPNPLLVNVGQASGQAALLSAIRLLLLIHTPIRVSKEEKEYGHDVLWISYKGLGETFY
jgi:hypothetical protein